MYLCLYGGMIQEVVCKVDTLLADKTVLLGAVVVACVDEVRAHARVHNAVWRSVRPLQGFLKFTSFTKHPGS